jgi:predicted nucleotidyltransferase
MQRDEVLQTLERHKHDLEPFRLRSLALFGSAARNEARPDSDLDFVVEFDGPATLDRYADLLSYLEVIFQRRIDLLTEASLPPSLRSIIQREAVYIIGSHSPSSEHCRSLRGAAKPFLRESPSGLLDWDEAVERSVAEDYAMKEI